MSYRFKGEYVILAGKRTKIVKQPLPTEPQDGEILIDQADDKLKVWNEMQNKWFILDDTSSPSKKMFALTLTRNGAANDVWLSLSESNIPTNTAPWTPPWDCKVIKVLMTNKVDGTSSSPLVTKIQAYHKGFDENGNISTGDSSGWYVDSEGPNIEQVGDDGRHWIYDNSTEGDYMYKNQKYGFRFQKIDGSGTPNDVCITLILEEV